jgi:hypothetical protein
MCYLWNTKSEHVYLNGEGTRSFIGILSDLRQQLIGKIAVSQ